MEGGGDAARRIAEHLAVALRRRLEGGAAGPRLPPLDDGVAFPHAAQVVHQGGGVAIGYRDGVRIHHRQGEAGALQQVAGVAHVGERGDPRTEAAFPGDLGVGEGGAKLLQGVPAEHGGKEQPVRFKGPADLHQGARQVVDPVQAQAAYDEVEALCGEGQELLVAGQAQGPRPAGHFRRQVALHKGLDAAPAVEQPSQFAAVAAEVEGDGETPRDVVEPVRQALAHLAQEEVVVPQPRRRAVPVAAHRRAVEHVHCSGHAALPHFPGISP